MQIDHYMKIVLSQRLLKSLKLSGGCVITTTPQIVFVAKIFNISLSLFKCHFEPFLWYNSKSGRINKQINTSNFVVTVIVLFSQMSQVPWIVGINNKDCLAKVNDTGT